jgi:hypothetical protein
MTEQTVPNTENLSIAALAVAWEIVKISYNVPPTRSSFEERAKILTNEVIKVHNAILIQKQME